MPVLDDDDQPHPVIALKAGAARDVTAMSDFHRIRRLPPYVFEEVNRFKAAARAKGADIIDLGMGNPDLPAPRHVVEKLVETVGRPRRGKRISRPSNAPSRIRSRSRSRS